LISWCSHAWIQTQQRSHRLLKISQFCFVLTMSVEDTASKVASMSVKGTIFYHLATLHAQTNSITILAEWDSCDLLHVYLLMFDWCSAFVLINITYLLSRGSLVSMNTDLCAIGLRIFVTVIYFTGNMNIGLAISTPWFQEILVQYICRVMNVWIELN
jgi:hypothetical protein